MGHLRGVLICAVLSLLVRGTVASDSGEEDGGKSERQQDHPVGDPSHDQNEQKAAEPTHQVVEELKTLYRNQFEVLDKESQELQALAAEHESNLTEADKHQAAVDTKLTDDQKELETKHAEALVRFKAMQAEQEALFTAQQNREIEKCEKERDEKMAAAQVRKDQMDKAQKSHADKLQSQHAVAKTIHEVCEKRDTAIIKLITDKHAHLEQQQAAIKEEQEGAHEDNKQLLVDHGDRITVNEQNLVVHAGKFEENDQKLADHDAHLEQHDNQLGEQKARLDAAEPIIARLDTTLLDTTDKQREHDNDIKGHEVALKAIGKDLTGVHEKAHEMEFLRGDPHSKGLVKNLTNRYSKITNTFEDRNADLRDRKRNAGDVSGLNFVYGQESGESDRSPTASGDGNNSIEDRRRLAAASTSSHRRLPAGYASMCPSEQALARRRLMSRPSSHLTVLEQLMGEISRLNATN